MVLCYSSFLCKSTILFVSNVQKDDYFCIFSCFRPKTIANGGCDFYVKC